MKALIPSEYSKGLVKGSHVLTQILLICRYLKSLIHCNTNKLFMSTSFLSCDPFNNYLFHAKTELSLEAHCYRPRICLLNKGIRALHTYNLHIKATGRHMMKNRGRNLIIANTDWNHKVFSLAGAEMSSEDCYHRNVLD